MKDILIVDDEIDTQNLILEFLKIEGYVCVCVGSGEEALKILENERFEVIILDVRLKKGGLSGIDTLKSIRKNDTQSCIIVTTAYASEQAMFNAVNKWGAQTYVKKAGQWLEDLIINVRQGLNWRDQSLNSIMKRCFLTGVQLCHWKVQEDHKTVFVGMPFTEIREHSFENVYNCSILPAIEKNELSAWRADKHMDNTAIMCKICRGIQQCTYAIIDITTWNSNVMFEFGIICGLGKKSIIIKDQESDVPTDLQGLEYIEYNDQYSELKNKLTDKLRKMINVTTE